LKKISTKIYKIPVEDKYIIYAPLKRLAFIGNKAMADTIFQGAATNDPEVIEALKATGIFEPDNIKLTEVQSKGEFLPTLCILMPTTACNLACTYCYANNGHKKHVTMTWETAKKGIDVAFENSKKQANKRFSLSFHGGGEPTLPHNIILKASRYARSLDPNCPISITSNCVWEPEFRNELLGLVNEISISFDGNKTTQDRQRPDLKGFGTFAKVMESINEIEKRNISYGIRMTLTNDSLPELYSNVEYLCNNTSCKTFQVEAVYNQGKAEGSGLKITDVDQFIENFMKAYDLARSKGRKLNHSAARPHQITNTFCTATQKALIVTSHGELTACYEVFDNAHPLANDFIIGNLNLKEGVKLYAKKREKLHQKIADNRSNCKDCFCYYHCAGDCPPKAFLARKSNDKFKCTVTREITKQLILDNIIDGDGIWCGNSKQKVTLKPVK
jgi:uncharacterized protein